MDTQRPDHPRTATAQMLVGAGSPLWAYYGAAAAGGIAYWLMTSWRRPMNLEAVFAAAADASPLALTAAAEEVVEAVAEATVEAAESVLAAAAGPVGGEAAPISPLVAAEGPIEAGAAPAAADPEPDTKPKVKKAPATDT